MSDQEGKERGGSYRMLLQGMEFTSAYLDDPDGGIPSAPVLLLRLRGPDEDGKLIEVTVGVDDVDIDQFLGSVQEAARSHKSGGL